jgi:predicted ferric reductase
MKYNVSRVMPWVGAYVALALTPLVLAMVGPTPEPRPFFVEVGVGLGFVGIGLIGLQFVLTGRFRSIAPIFGGDVVLQFHRQIGIVAVGLVLAHPVVLIAQRARLPRVLRPTGEHPAGAGPHRRRAGADPAVGDEPLA